MKNKSSHQLCQASTPSIENFTLICRPTDRLIYAYTHKHDEHVFWNARYLLSQKSGLFIRKKHTNLIANIEREKERYLMRRFDITKKGIKIVVANDSVIESLIHSAACFSTGSFYFWHTHPANIN